MESYFWRFLYLHPYSVHFLSSLIKLCLLNIFYCFNNQKKNPQKYNEPFQQHKIISQERDTFTTPTYLPTHLLHFLQHFSHYEFPSHPVKYFTNFCQDGGGHICDAHVTWNGVVRKSNKSRGLAGNRGKTCVLIAQKVNRVIIKQIGCMLVGLKGFLFMFV